MNKRIRKKIAKRNARIKLDTDFVADMMLSAITPWPSSESDIRKLLDEKIGPPTEEEIEKLRVLYPRLFGGKVVYYGGSQPTSEQQVTTDDPK